MSSLKAFLTPVEVKEKEVVISKRYMEGGKAMVWKLRPITQEENSEIIRQCTRKNKKGESERDELGYSQELAAAGVVFPDLNNAELQSTYGVIGAAKLLQKMLLIGEYARLLQEIYQLSDMDQDINEEMEEAKN